MKTTIYTHDSALRHDTGPGHPERSDRLRVLQDLFDEPPFEDIPQVRAPAVGMDQLMLAHDENYILSVEEKIPEPDDGGLACLDGDTVVCSESWEAAMRSVGAVCKAVDDVVSGTTTRAFCAMRPPGHHAEPSRAMGFCLFNNIFIGARHAQTAHGIKKIAIIDFDVHHGNGTDVMTRAHDGSIFFVSTHQFPLWPMTGLPEDNDDKVNNWTFPPGAGSDLFRPLYEQKVFPAVKNFAPDLLMISAGFDAHKDDPVGGMTLTEDDYAWVTKGLCDIADEYCQGRVISVLEGGYNLDALKSSAAAHLKTLAGL